MCVCASKCTLCVHLCECVCVCICMRMRMDIYSNLCSFSSSCTPIRDPCIYVFVAEFVSMHVCLCLRLRIDM